ncbi:YHS domain-containing (seleno)protein [Pedobacter cryophilus]|uniref:YHS domain protein n=1 Tax=Pedobacter cryophilus TaxID=2571271 RepID=A0A4U1C1Q0_9SPHI|nr:YHS domain-containing (seleno)protein [Pedobacter cryophilus]TKB99005.1 YHS domain protein [Pedobacter cryophilus]
MKKSILILTIIFSFLGHLSAQEKAVFQTKEGAIKGYDAVAYFKENKAVKGNEKYSYLWKDALWLFSNKENLKAFKSHPEKFEPQFGGYCAYGYAKGHAAPVDPNAFKIVDGKLYLNYNSDVQQLWNKDIQGFINDALKNYKADLIKSGEKGN